MFDKILEMKAPHSNNENVFLYCKIVNDGWAKLYPAVKHLTNVDGICP